MEGKILKEKLRSWNVNFSKLSFDLGYNNDQYLHQRLRAKNVSSTLIENIAKVLNRSITDFYDDINKNKDHQNYESVSRKLQKTIESQQNTIDRLTSILNKISQKQI